jgi:predicted outer membrane repeat protein
MVHAPEPLNWRGLALMIGFCLMLVGWIHPLPSNAAAEVVGNGTPASCTRTALATAVADGGAISFNCGSDPVTIDISTPLTITAPETSIDGGGSVTLRGVNSQIIEHYTWGYIGSSRLTLSNLTISGGRASGPDTTANGGAIESYFAAADPAYTPTLIIENVIFRDNESRVTSLTSGQAYDYGGGAIYSRGGAVEVRNSQFIDNDAHNGGGGAIHILQSGLSVSDTSFSNNTAIGARPQDSLGGAIYVDGLGGENGRLNLIRTTFSNNQAYNSGGAIYVNMYENSSGVVVVDSSFEGNRVVGGTRAQGGAIGGGGTTHGAGTGNPTISISRSLFYNNSVRRTPQPGDGNREDGSGGALAFPQRARLTIENSTFVGNRAYGSSYNANGGALYVVNNSDRFEINNSTFAQNRAGWVGGAISNSRINEQPGGRVRNSLFVDNTADNGPNDWNIQQHCSSELVHDSTNLQYPPRQTGANFWNDVTCFAGLSDPSQTAEPVFRDPQLLALSDNGGPTRTMAIGVQSPAFNAGSGCAAQDQRGIARPQAGACDIGAYELAVMLQVSHPLLEVGSGAQSIYVLGAGFDASSIVQINGANRSTTLVDTFTLKVDLTAGDTAGLANLTVGISGPGSELDSATIRVIDEVFRLNLPIIRS